VQDAALSLPVVIGEKGVVRVIVPDLTAKEKSVFLESARKVAAAVKGGAA
jgi:malate/lactate dehydrogenase